MVTSCSPSVSTVGLESGFQAGDEGLNLFAQIPLEKLFQQVIYACELGSENAVVWTDHARDSVAAVAVVDLARTQRAAVMRLIDRCMAYLGELNAAAERQLIDFERQRLQQEKLERETAEKRESIDQMRLELGLPQ